MMTANVYCFQRFPFEPGQKIHINDGPRKGDWLVISVDEKKVGLRCPVSGIEVSWNRFCYLVSEQETEFPARE